MFFHVCQLADPSQLHFPPLPTHHWRSQGVKHVLRLQAEVAMGVRQRDQLRQQGVGTFNLDSSFARKGTFCHQGRFECRLAAAGSLMGRPRGNERAGEHANTKNQPGRFDGDTHAREACLT